jgi:SAM-dependent methyltransferase
MRACPACGSEERNAFDEWSSNFLGQRFLDDGSTQDFGESLHLYRCGHCSMCYIGGDYDPNTITARDQPLDRAGFREVFEGTSPASVGIRNAIAMSVYRLVASKFQEVRLLDYGSTYIASYLRWATYYPRSTAVAYDVHIESADVDGIAFRNSVDDLRALGPFAGIICNQVIEHCVDPRKELANIYELLLPGGFAYFALPLVDYRKLPGYRANRYAGSPAEDIFNPTHINYYSPQLFADALKAAGFQIVPIQLDFTAAQIPPRGLVSMLRQMGLRLARYMGFRAMVATGRFPGAGERFINGFFVTRS